MARMEHSWTVILLAGQRPGVDPLAQAFGQTYKALIDIAGQPMVARVVETLLRAPNIGKIIILAQQPGAIMPVLPPSDRIVVRASGSGISASIRAVTNADDARWPFFVTTADHPLLTVAMIDAFLTGAADHDLAVGMVEREVVRAAYPDNKRTWLKFSDGAWSGANLFALTSSKTSAALDLWAKAEQDRKHAWKLFLHFGPWLAFRALTRTIGLADAVRLAGARLGLNARLVAVPVAEAAIDVDKLSDHTQVEAILREQARQTRS
jgi:CTP:molybdopterin cytidylyltransferase MocA